MSSVLMGTDIPLLTSLDVNIYSEPLIHQFGTIQTVVIIVLLDTLLRERAS